MMFPSSVERVPRNTARKVNEAIRRATERNIAYYASAGPEAIEQRLIELDREWDIERALEANFGSVSLVSTILGATVHRAFRIVGAAASALLIVHAVQGWCPPLPILRRLGFRTRSEIEEERYALKVLRGDFYGMPTCPEAVDRESIERVLQAVRRGGDRPLADAPEQWLRAVGRSGPTARSHCSALARDRADDPGAQNWSWPCSRSYRSAATATW